MKVKNPERSASSNSLVGREDVKIPKKVQTAIVLQHQTASPDGGHIITSLWQEQEREPIMDTLVNDNQASHYAAGTQTTQERSRAYRCAAISRRSRCSPTRTRSPTRRRSSPIPAATSAK
jgi:hypothetical protein